MLQPTSCYRSHPSPRLCEASAHLLLAPTSLCDLGKSQTCTPLEVDVLGKHKGAEGSEWLAGEEIGFTTLGTS